MIASENFVPQAILEAQGSVLTNKYAEGYPGKRYDGGGGHAAAGGGPRPRRRARARGPPGQRPLPACAPAGVLDAPASDRAKALFGAEHANVQPHAGAQANTSVMHALIRPGDTILGLELAHGGHLTHGMKINFSGRLYDVAAYGVSPETHLVDMDAVRAVALERRPKLIIAG